MRAHITTIISRQPHSYIHLHTNTNIHTLACAGSHQKKKNVNQKTSIVRVECSIYAYEAILSNLKFKWHSLITTAKCKKINVRCHCHSIIDVVMSKNGDRTIHLTLNALENETTCDSIILTDFFFVIVIIVVDVDVVVVVFCLFGSMKAKANAVHCRQTCRWQSTIRQNERKKKQQLVHAGIHTRKSYTNKRASIYWFTIICKENPYRQRNRQLIEGEILPCRRSS